MDFSNIDFYTIAEIFAMVVGFVYVLLEVKQKSSMWYFWIVTAIAYFIVYGHKGVYAMMLIQIYYMIACIFGINRWRKSKKEGMKKYASSDDKAQSKKDILIIKKLKPKVAIVSSVIALDVFCIMGYLFELYTDNPRPYFDSLVATMSMLATYWLSLSYIQQWHIWIVVNIISIVLFFQLKMYPTTILYVSYLVMAIYGLYNWKKRGVMIDV